MTEILEPLGQKKSVTPTRVIGKIGQSQNSAVAASSRSVSTKRETRSSTAAQLAIEKNLPEASKFDSKKATEEALVLRDITA